jgi:hypothetical protein
MRLYSRRGFPRRSIIIAAAVALIICLVPWARGNAQAQETVPNPLAPPVSRVVALDGHVLSVGHGVAHADVRLLQSGTVIANTLSDATGLYRFTNAVTASGIPPLVRAGAYSLEAQYRGTTKSFGSVSIRSDATIHHDIDLGAIDRAGGALLRPRATLIATDRVAGSDPATLNGAFSNERPVLACQPTPDCALHLGIVQVNGPILGSVEPSPDLTSFMTVMHAAYPNANTMTIFVHGFNNDFEGPVRMAASAIASVDVESVPLAYSWPSKAVTAKYIDDETSNGWAAEHFRDFLVALLERQDGPATVNILAHSMGNRLAVSALQYIARAKPTFHGHIGQVVFAAPDVDAATFWEALPMMATAAQGLTVYGSTHDEALQLSRELHGHCRAGLVGCDDTVTLPANANAVDASFFHCDFIGHGYWAASTTMLGDITAVMHAGAMAAGAPARAHLMPAGSPGHYRFVSAAGDDTGCAAEPTP